MKIIQVLTTLAFGDAVGNNCVAIKHYLQEKGYETEIYAENIDNRLPKNIAKNIDKLGKLSDEDILIYHYAIGCELNKKIKEYGGKVVFQYHNVTPPEFFTEYNDDYYNVCSQGVAQLKMLNKVPKFCLADSEFNKQDLINAGYKCPIDVCPILIPYEDYEKTPNQKVINKYKDDGYVNFLFVGRIAPNKCQEDVVKTFAWYQKHINKKCRLFLVGSEGVPTYSKRLRDYIDVLGVDNVILPGHIKFDEILAYYHIADIFLCMSCHEGFCVPLIEAMYFKIPIVARNTTAIPYTLGKGGILVEDNDPVKAALVADKILTNKALRDQIVADQNEHMKKFSNQYVKTLLDSAIQKWI